MQGTVSSDYTCAGTIVLHTDTQKVDELTTEWPGCEPVDLELADPNHLMAANPTLRQEIEEFG